LIEDHAAFAVMGIVNVTPDSFSDGGRFLDPERAVAHGVALEREGAAILDIAGESTRPGAQPVSPQDELARVIPVIEGLRAAGVTATISIDTSKAAVAAAAIDAGAEIVNDVTALRGDPAMADLIASRAGVRCVLTHMLGEPRTMQDDPRYGDVVAEVAAFLGERLHEAVARGIAAERIWLDPGIGFGKTVAHNVELLRRLPELSGLGRPLVLGASRKSFLGTLTGRGFGDRGAATIAANVLGFQGGARIFRVHDVAETRDALLVTAATVPADVQR
jgi:dihydropteroate synthase